MVCAKNTTLLDRILSHENDYGFDPRLVLQGQQPISNLSIVIPYYDTGDLIQETLRHIYNAIANVLAIHHDWLFEVLVFDDGSQQRPANKYINPSDWYNTKLFYSETNTGRARTRNSGLDVAKYAKCAFIDSDILIDNKSLLHNLRLHRLLDTFSSANAITANFFENTSDIPSAAHLTPEILRVNDFRVHCRYKESWIGTHTDKRYIGEEFRLVVTTDAFRTWKGFYGPWCLPNMVLGGFFVVDTHAAVAVNGFDIMFSSYGFTETSLVSKLVANGTFVIPQVIGGAVHCERNPAHNSQETRDMLFRRAHHLYFNTYLTLPFTEAVNRPLVGWR